MNCFVCNYSGTLSSAEQILFFVQISNIFPYAVMCCSPLGSFEASSGTFLSLLFLPCPSTDDPLRVRTGV